MDGGVGSAQNLRRKRLTIAAWVAVFGAANVIGALLGIAALQIGIAVVTLLALIMAAILQTRELGLEHSEHVETLLRAPVKTVRTLNAYEAGVAPEAPAALNSTGHPGDPRYLPRDVDVELDAALEAALGEDTTSLIVVSGPSKAGKTRALFEAMQRHAPDAHVVIPNDGDALEELMQPGVLPHLKGAPVVLWLDDLELYLKVGPHGMHSGVLEQLSARDGSFVVLATAGGKGAVQAAGEASQFAIPMVELLRHAREISLSSDLSSSEQSALQGYAPDAAEQIARDGIGEYMIAAPDLERKLTSGCHHHGDPPSPHGQAVASAAIDWQRAGITDPIPRTVLRAVYGNYLADHVDPSDAGFEEGLEWARKPLYSTVALVSGRDPLQPYDHIVSYVESALEREIDKDAWRQFLEASTDNQAFDLASGAHSRSKDDPGGEWDELAERAIRRPMASDSASLAGTAAFNLGVLLEKRMDTEGAMAAYRLAEERGAVSGTVNLGNLFNDQGDLDSAAAAFRRAEEQGDVAGAFNLGNLLRESGDLEGAEAAYRRADEQGNDKAAYNLGNLLRESGDLEGAEAAYRRAADRGHVKATYNLGCSLRESGDAEGAKAAFRRADERGNPKAAVALGRMLYHAADLGAAEAAFRRAADRGDEEGLSGLGVLLSQQGDVAGAESAFRRADEMGDGAGAFGLGLVLAAQEDVEGARDALERAVGRGYDKASAALETLSSSPMATDGDLEAAEQDVGVGDQGGGDHQQDRGDEY